MFITLCISLQCHCDQGDNGAITEYERHFRHLLELWEKRADAFGQDLDLSQARGSEVIPVRIFAGFSWLLVAGLLIAAGKQAMTPSKTELFDLKAKCKEAGTQYAEALKKGGEDTGQFATQPRFGYSAELNTCIIRAGC